MGGKRILEHQKMNNHIFLYANESRAKQDKFRKNQKISRKLQQLSFNHNQGLRSIGGFNRGSFSDKLFQTYHRGFSVNNNQNQLHENIQ